MQELKTNSLNEVLLGSKQVVFYDFFKRIFDIISSIFGIIILAPVFIIIGLIIKLDSKGPVFFSHKRIGKYGKLIYVYKFRTMGINAQEILENLPEDKKREFEINFKFENDPRITKVGNFLRRTSLDEIPQLFNILEGNMSVVGPRPVVQEELKKYGLYSNKLISVKPGLTGNWQANGRSNTSYEQRINLDMEYIDRRNLFIDMKIILKTIVCVAEKHGAR